MDEDIKIIHFNSSQLNQSSISVNAMMRALRIIDFQRLNTNRDQYYFCLSCNPSELN